MGKICSLIIQKKRSLLRNLAPHYSEKDIAYEKTHSFLPFPCWHFHLVAEIYTVSQKLKSIVEIDSDAVFTSTSYKEASLTLNR